jgi:outer membrane receptor protein involved in Fe transport
MVFRDFLKGGATVIAIASGFAAAVPGVAQAQQSASTENALEDIIVTARKREERSIDVPIALTAITGETLERRGVRNIAEFLQEAPGVGIYDSGNGMNKVTIRGVSTSLGANENGYYLDDLPFTGVTVPLVPDVRAWDLERVEVLRGPQGTLFGEGALGGTIRILTADADLNDFEAKASGSASSTDGGGENYGIKGAVNLPIIQDVLAVRLAATHETFDGWIDNNVTGATNLNEQTFDTFRAKVRFDPNDRLSIRGSYWKSEADFPNGGASATDDGQQSQSTVLSNAVNYELFGGSARYDLGGSELFYGYSNNSFVLPQSGALSGGTLEATISIDVEAHEFRWSSTGAGALQWTVGAYQREAKRSDDLQFALFGIDNVSNTDTKAQALFGEATYSFSTVPVDVTAGLRYFHDELENVEANAGVFGDPIGDTYESWNPRFAVSWKPQQNVNIYASAAKGFRSGQTQPSTSVALAEPYGIILPEALAQDSIWTYEIGAKADLMDRMLSVEAAVYFSQWKDVTVRIPIADTGFNGLINSEGTETKGVELSVVARLIEGLTLTASGSYNDAEYVGGVPGTAIVDGSPVDEVAKYTASASADYRWVVSGDIGGFARASWQYTSPRSFDSFPLYQEGDTINRVDARLGVDFDTVTVALFVDNLTNEDGATTYRAVSALGGGAFDIVSPRLRPRTIGIEATLRFGS